MAMSNIGTDLALALDPVLLARAAGMEPDLWQERLLRSDASRIMLNCSRQSGKSTMAALLALHTALYDAGSLTLVVSRAQRQSGELARKVTRLYNALGRPVPATAESALQLELQNGSRIVALPGSEGTIRSYSEVALLVVDEASRVPDETYYSVRPMLAVSQGRLVTLSTPYGTRGWWHEAYRSLAEEQAVGDGWLYIEVPADQCPRISASFLAEERRTMGQWWFDQEYMCAWLDSQTAAFRTEDIEAAFTGDVLLPDIEFYLDPRYADDPEARDAAIMASHLQRAAAQAAPPSAALPTSAFASPEGLKRWR